MVTTPGKLLELQVTGTNAGTWGDVLNDDVITILDNALSQPCSLSLSSTPVTLSASQAQMGLLVFTGTLTANVAVTSAQNGVYWVENRTSGNFYVSLTNGTGNAMLVPQGAGRQVWADSTYGVRALNMPPPGSFLYLGAATPHPSMLATTSLVGEYLLCDGSSFLTTGVTANLYQAIGVTWGAGPLLPDLRGRGLFGKDNMGGSAAGRITTAGSSIDGSTVGSVGGAQNVTLIASQLPSNIPGSAVTTLINGTLVMRTTSLISVSGSGAALAGASGGTTINEITASTALTINPSGDAAHTNMPPAAICNVLIKI